MSEEQVVIPEPEDSQEVKDKKAENWKAYLRIQEKNLDKAAERRDYAIKQFDTLMIALSTAGLGFTSNYIKGQTGDTYWARVSQILFLACLVINLLSHLFSMWSHRVGCEASNKEFEVDLYGEDHVQGFEQVIHDTFQLKSKRRKRILNNMVRACNIIAFATLCSAITCFICYTFIA